MNTKPDFFYVRKRLELSFLRQTPLRHAVVDNPGNNWDAVWTQIKAYL